MRFKKALEKLDYKSAVIGFFLGIAGMWIIFLSPPLLSSLEDKGSYAYGQQVGKNLQESFVEINPRVFLAGLNDGLKGFTQINEAEKQTALQHLSKKSMPKRLAAINKNPPQQDQNRTTQDGFRETPFGFSYQRVSWQQYQNLLDAQAKGKTLEETQVADPVWKFQNQNSDLKYTFRYKIYDSSGQILFELPPSESLSYTSKQLPKSLATALSGMSKANTWLLKINEQSNNADQPNNFRWPIDLNNDMIFEITLIN